MVYVWGQAVTALKPLELLVLQLTKLMQKISINICQNKDMKNLEYLWCQLLVMRVLAMTNKLSDVFVVLASIILCYFNTGDYLILNSKHVNTKWRKNWLMWVYIFKCKMKIMVGSHIALSATCICTCPLAEIWTWHITPWLSPIGLAF
jgi:hypothetical protein